VPMRMTAMRAVPNACGRQEIGPRRLAAIACCYFTAAVASSIGAPVTEPHRMLNDKLTLPAAGIQRAHAHRQRGAPRPQ
jgi:hypothetical protein